MKALKLRNIRYSPPLNLAPDIVLNVTNMHLKLDYKTFFVPLQCQRIVRTKLMPYCTLLPNFLQGELSVFVLFV